MEAEEVQRKSRSKSANRGSSRDRSKRRRSRSRSRSRNIKRSRSRSLSPFRPGWKGGFRGGRGRFNRRSPPPFRGRGGFRDRFRRSRSTSRGRFDRRRYDEHDHRRSRSVSPNRPNNDYAQQQQQQHQQTASMGYGNETYGNYVPQFPGSMAQFNTYDFQASYPPPTQNFPMGMGSTCHAPPGLSDWQPPQASMPSESEEDKLRREAAIAEEKKRQREGLKKQRDQYISRSEKMKRELKMLKEQKSGLLDGLGKRSPSPKTNGFIKENDKLQAQISSKLSEILNVIDMLSGIIGKDSDEDDARKKSDSDSSPERIKSKLLESMKGKKKDNERNKINFIYYDPELHWCKPCQAFPKTAQDYLNHLHTKEHLDKIANRASEAPWRAGFQKINDVPSYSDAPTKRAPIKGLQFFEPATAWFCKLCEMFMGDSWCTSLHLKSAIHAERYAKFIEKEPKFEEKWLEARTKAFDNFGCLDSIVEQHQKASLANPQDSNDKKLLDKKKKKKNKKDGKKKRKRGKKRKHSSSSSDSDGDSDSSSTTDSEKKGESNSENKNSIRVAMRNFLRGGPSENEKSGWTKVSLDPNKPAIPPPPAISQNAAKETRKDEQIINQWSTVEPIISQEEKRLLENLKGRYKQNKPENEKPVVPPPPIVTSRRKSRERERSRSKERKNERNFRNRKSRSRSRGSPRRRSNSRDRRRSPRRSPRYGRRYSRSRSRSPRFTRPHIVFPTEPRLPPLREEKKQPARSYVITKKEEPAATSFALANASKRMPMIGKMPVFKKQLTTEKKSEIMPEEKQEEEMTINSAETLEAKNRNEDWNDLMPDPMSYSAMMNSAAQPVPPAVSEQPDAPPGLDPEMDSEFIPKPISDAPMMRKGPLPKDLQATLDILFDGDSMKPVVIEPAVPEVPVAVPMPVDNDGPQMIMAEELSQHSILYGNYDIQPVPAPPKISKESEDDKKDTMEVEESDEKAKNQEDMDDLALLGIDVNDVGSGLW